ncbi:hypothetical protein B0H17DRAFT_1210948 [Mycena rosella]|uniref:Uncharacterized protein n=1 Tax=Mycena rosella TaxID=1033263 RepID=A0AAD7CVF8_MYCRO|nr:hypothetical protein B0H17DRAFT_1210948 [Mycena rosella]
MHVSHPLKLLTPTRPTIDYSLSRIAPTRIAAYPEPHNRAIHRARLTPVSPAITRLRLQQLYLVFGGSASGIARSSSCRRVDRVHIRLVSHFALKSSFTFFLRSFIEQRFGNPDQRPIMLSL